MYFLLVACAAPVRGPVDLPQVAVAGFGAVGVRPAVGPARATVVNLGVPLAEVPEDVLLVDVPIAAFGARAAAPCRDYDSDLDAIVAAVHGSRQESADPALLVGQGWGAAASWAALAQSAGARWVGAVGGDFCPSLATETPLCGAPGWVAGDPPQAALPPSLALTAGRFIVARACPTSSQWLSIMGPRVHNAPTVRVGITQLLRTLTVPSAAEPP